jgi:hypothetical protein
VACTTKKTQANSGANLGFVAKRILAADHPRNNMDASKYNHLVLRLIMGSTSQTP